MNKLIVTADDLGFSPSVNGAIIEAHKNGILTAASLMVNMPFAEQAAEQVSTETPKLGLGLHICLTSGKPVSHPSEVPLLVNKNGDFCRSFPSLLALLNFSSARKKANARTQVEKEILAQFDKMRKFVRQYNLVFDHLDSHQHIHFIPGIDAAVWRVLDEWNNELRDRSTPPLILRRPVEIFGTYQRVKSRFSKYFPGGLAKKMILTKLSEDSIQMNNRSDVPFPGYFGILETGKMNASAWESAMSVFEKLPVWKETVSGESGRVAELNLHPSLDANIDSRCCCSKADRKFHQSPFRRQEFETLVSSATVDLLAKYNIETTSFGNI
ncbi:MAG: ChbG/HpnK family deacetylase [Thermoguttaceae bacterium]|nr:ChbG/HpnK family deacetylase [Thermoguttaceae bacterium]MBQ6616735.1 ChbG/HpnK family deacetylase [Thermoguttaceae bacterium]